MRIIGAISLLVLVGSPLAAQPDSGAGTASPALLGAREGQRVLLVEGRGRKQVARIGRVVTVDSATVTMIGERGDTARVATSAVRQAFLSEGRRSRGSAAVTGGAIGLVIGGALGYSAGSDCGTDSFVCFDRGSTTPVGAMAGMGLGALLGAAVGGGERWRALTLPSRTALELRPVGAGLVARVTF